MDIVKFRRVNPLFLQIVDFELDVRRDEVGLYGTDIVSKNLCRGVLISHVYRPDTSTCSYIQYPLRVVANGCKVQFATQTERLDVMIEIKPVVLFLQPVSITLSLRDDMRTSSFGQKYVASSLYPW